MEKDRTRRALPNLAAAGLLALLALSLVPILLVGDCAHPFGDDFAFSVFVRHALEEGRSALGALLYTVRRYYFGWQGTYAATALMALQPGLWSEQAYVLTPVVMLSMLIFSTGALSHTVLRRYLGASRPVWLGAAAGLLLVTIQYQPSVMQAFFWWNGAMFYTFFYALMLLLIDCVLRLRLCPRHPRLLMAAALLLAAAVGGGNYVTGLFSCLLCAGYILLCLFWDRERLRQCVPVGAALLICFLVNALAPGNRVRQAQSAGMSAPRAVLAAILQAGRDCVGWASLPLLALLICMAPVLWRALEKADFSFPLPAGATLLLFLALACQNAPHFYALSGAGPGRLRDVVYDSYPWLLLLAEGYWLGWLRRRLGDRRFPRRFAQTLVAAGLCAAALGVLLLPGRTTSGQCIAALSDGSARSYDACVEEWVRALREPGVEDVVVRQPEVRPPLLYLFNLEDDPTAFANTAAANYYHKNSVTAVYGPPDA